VPGEQVVGDHAERVHVGDSLLGGTGDDRMYGDSGDDLLRGGVGSDRAFGAEGKADSCKAEIRQSCER